MVDVVSPAVRSRMMSGIKGKDTKPEVFVRAILTAAGLRYRLHRRDLPGSPDIVLPGRHVAIFVHGCFWHAHSGCRLAAAPSTRPEFWRAKLEGNVERDDAAVAKLGMLGWRVLVVWECSTRRGGVDDLPGALRAWIEGDAEFGEIGAPPQSSS
jgi:DNA mismatch endonuclease (patch repair protein)